MNALVRALDLDAAQVEAREDEREEDGPRPRTAPAAGSCPRSLLQMITQMSGFIT